MSGADLAVRTHRPTVVSASRDCGSGRRMAGYPAQRRPVGRTGQLLGRTLADSGSAGDHGRGWLRQKRVARQTYDQLTAARPTVLLPCGRIPTAADLTDVARLDQAFGHAVGDSRTSPPLTEIVAWFGGGSGCLWTPWNLSCGNADDLAFLLRRLAGRADLILTRRDWEWRGYLEADRGLVRLPDSSAHDRGHRHQG